MTGHGDRVVSVFPGRGALTSALAEELAADIEQKAPARGTYSLALAGGSTPRELYEKLAGPPYRDAIPWQRVHVFWGDERMVNREHADSNYRMAREALLDHVPLPEQNVHRIRGEAIPGVAADEYSITLRTICGDPPRLDFVLLGMGPDGHTASLFPGTVALRVGDRPATGVYVPRLCAWRVSLTLPVINNADRVVFLVAGKDKAETVSRVLSLDEPEKWLPASMVAPHRALAHWMIDAAAASLLDGKD